MGVPQGRARQPRKTDAGIFGAEISSFRLYLAAEGKAPKTIRLYSEAVAWCAAARLLGVGKVSWEQADRRDVQERVAWLLGRYSDAYASSLYRALRQFFRWLSAEEAWLTRWRGCARPGSPASSSRSLPAAGWLAWSGRARGAGSPGGGTRPSSVLRACGIGLSGLAGIGYDPGSQRCSDLDLWQREICVRGKGGRRRIVKISCDAARALDRCLRARARHPQAWRVRLWLGAGSRAPLTVSGIYQIITRRGRHCGVDAWPRRFRHHFSRTWLERGGPEGDLMELNGWSSPQMRAATAPAPAAPVPGAPTTAS